MSFSPGSQPADARPVRNVLVVDDVPEIGSLYRDLLKRVKGVRVNATIEVRSKRAIDLLQSEKFDLVITDFRMPEFTGADVIATARRTQPHAHLLLMSGYLESAADKLPEEGLSGVLSKPLNMVELLGKLEKLLREPRGA